MIGVSNDHLFDRGVRGELRIRQHTRYKPESDLLAYCAATEVINNTPLIGSVHDPLARISMQCVSGNAGLFSNADDLAVFAAMLKFDPLHNQQSASSRRETQSSVNIHSQRGCIFSRL